MNRGKHDIPQKNKISTLPLQNVQFQFVLSNIAMSIFVVYFYFIFSFFFFSLI